MSGSQPHYFSGQPSTPSERRPVTVELPDLRLDLIADSGVFSARALDPGTRILLEHAPQPPGDRLLDLGCGYGAIALTLATRRPTATVWAVDVNERALDLTGENAAAAGLVNVRAAKPDDVPPDVRFDAIYSNPPIRVGKPVLHAMLRQWLARLAPDGVAYLVVAKQLGSDSLAGWLTEQGYPCTRFYTRKGYRILAVRAQPE